MEAATILSDTLSSIWLSDDNNNKPVDNGKEIVAVESPTSSRELDLLGFFGRSGEKKMQEGTGKDSVVVAKENDSFGGVGGVDKEEDMLISTEPPNSRSEERRLFSCNYCRRKFYSSQALGGHQNAHKQERSLLKHSGRHRMDARGHFSTSSFSSLPLLVGGSSRPLGIQLHSMIHKPYFLPYAYGRSLLNKFNGHVPMSRRLTTQDFRATSPRFDMSAANRAADGSYVCAGSVDNHVETNEREENVQNLDLDLKL